MPSEPKSILIVEDDSGLAELLRSGLAEHGFAAEVAHSGRAGLARLGIVTPDLLLLDYSLPDMQATAMVDELARAARLPPFLVITGHGDERVAVQLMKLGARDYLVKDALLLDRLPRIVERIFQDLEKERRLAAAEQALRQSEDRYRSLVEASPDRILLLDRDRRVAFASPPSRSPNSVYMPEDLVGRDALTFIVPEDRERIAAILAELLTGGRQQANFEYHVLKPDGGKYPVEASTAAVRDGAGAVTGLMAVIRDISGRKLAEEQMQLQIHALQAAGNAIVITDARGVMEWGNDTFETLIGYTQAEIIGKPLLILNSKENAYDGLTDRIWEDLRAGKSWHGEYRTWRKGGGEYREESTITPVLDSRGRIAKIIVIKQDVTERRALEDALSQSRKMDSIGQLAGGVAHDFNNALMVILGYGDDLLRSLPPEHPRRQDVEEILKAGRHATNLTRQLLAFSRKQMLQPVVLDLNATMRNVEAMLRRLIGEDITLNVELAADLGRVKADPSQVEQVIMNLAVNARDAMPVGGCLTLGTANVHLAGGFSWNHERLEPGAYVMLAITDTGCGMDEAVMGKIFEPFFTTKEKGKGTGLGLSMVYGIVRQSGGGINVVSIPGSGTTFKIYLPRTEEPIPKLAELLPEPLPVANPAPPRILVVEDEPALRCIMERMLTSMGYHVTLAANGREGVAAVAEKGLTPDLLITDVVMPGMSGDVLAGHLRTRLPGLRILFMSGYSDDVIGHHGVLGDNISLLNKPFSRNEIEQAIRKILSSG